MGEKKDPNDNLPSKISMPNKTSQPSREQQLEALNQQRGRVRDDRIDIQTNIGRERQAIDEDVRNIQALRQQINELETTISTLLGIRDRSEEEQTNLEVNELLLRGIREELNRLLPAINLRIRNFLGRDDLPQLDRVLVTQHRTAINSPPRVSQGINVEGTRTRSTQGVNRSNNPRRNQNDIVTGILLFVVVIVAGFMLFINNRPKSKNNKNKEKK